MTEKLLIIAAGYPTPASFAGAFHRDQFRLIAQSGFDVTVVVPVPWVPPALARLRPRWRAYADFPLRQIDGDITILRPRYATMPGETRWGYPDLAQSCAARALGLSRPDLIQGFFGFPPGAVARRLALAWDVPYLVGLLGDDVNVYPAQRSRNRRVLTAVVRDAAFAFANGSTLAEHASSITGVAVANLPIGVDAERFVDLPGRHEARAALGLPADKTLALYIGALIPAKGTPELIEALGALGGELIGVSVGGGPMSEQFCKAPNTICLGVRPPHEVALAMAAADFLVHPSHSEGTPISVLEAAFARLPIVTTDARGCIDLGRDGRALIVPVADAKALAVAMARAAREPAIMKRCADLMLAHVSEYHSLAANTGRLVEHYRRCMARHRPARG